MHRVKLVREVIGLKQYIKILYGDIEGRVKADAKVLERLANLLRNSLNLNVDSEKLRECLEKIVKGQADELEVIVRFCSKKTYIACFRICNEYLKIVCHNCIKAREV
ncbi:MAG: hypothetical protein QXP57_09075 [Nitrososphaerota archaeon]